MINYIQDALVNLNGAILFLYFVVVGKQRTREAVAILFVFVACMAISSFESATDDVYQFSLYGGLYLLLAKWLIMRGNLARFGALMMSFYCFVYAADSWINSDVETWLWRNHEILVTSLHVFIMLLLSKVRPALVRSRFHA